MQFVTEDILLRYRCNKGEHYLRFQHHVSPASSSLAGLFRGAFIPSQKRMEKGNDIYENDSADYDRWLALVARLRLGWFFVFCVAAPTDCQVLVRSSDYFDLCFTAPAFCVGCFSVAEHANSSQFDDTLREGDKLHDAWKPLSLVGAIQGCNDDNLPGISHLLCELYNVWELVESIL